MSLCNCFRIYRTPGMWALLLAEELHETAIKRNQWPQDKNPNSMTIACPVLCMEVLIKWTVVIRGVSTQCLSYPS
ncbi:hypothetical protein LOAG_07982 [Loa loa]|uniref:Uncharacterized protein n=1 Tax=Loa loa TaxID=7209 RepID=A0A1S0TWC1_LOALO|nr:hypothetical protein LOAG_07982 [Loa loa]EFO20507.1 hypothetical protein LOAG_07982 [Loa loa]